MVILLTFWLTRIFFNPFCVGKVRKSPLLLIGCPDILWHVYRECKAKGIDMSCFIERSMNGAISNVSSCICFIENRADSALWCYPSMCLFADGMRSLGADVCKIIYNKVFVQYEFGNSAWFNVVCNVQSVQHNVLCRPFYKCFYSLFLVCR